jgi:predicted nucleotidyltransferase
MRISERIKIKIKKSIDESFGDIEIYLFGSRVDDDKKGGDIDLAIRVDISKEEFRNRKIKFLSSMMRLGFELKIDLVQYEKNGSLLSNEIEKTGIKL